MGSHRSEEGTARVPRDGSLHTIRFRERFSGPPQIEFARESKPRGRPLIESNITVHELGAEYFVVSVRHPMGGHEELDWTVAGSRRDGGYRALKLVEVVVGLLASAVGVYAALVGFGAIPNVFER